jgi:hypothetical protein
VSAGAKWLVDGTGTLENSGATVTGLSAGGHTVSFNTVSGWTTPASQSVTIKSKQTTTTTGTFLIQDSIANGIYSHDFSSGVPLWDISGGYSGTVGKNIGLGLSISEASSGKLTGTGTFNSNDGSGNVLNSNISVSGMVKSSGTATLVTMTISGSGSGTAFVTGTTKVSGSTVVTGTTHAVTFTGKITLNGKIDGTHGNLVVTGGSAMVLETDLVTHKKISKSIKLQQGTTLVLPTNVTGGWILTLNVTPSNNKYTGSATVQTSTGGSVPLTATGSFAPATNTSAITLKGTGGGSLSLVVSTLGSNMTVQSAKGTMYGQSVNFKAP